MAVTTNPSAGNKGETALEQRVVTPRLNFVVTSHLPAMRVAVSPSRDK